MVCLSISLKSRNTCSLTSSHTHLHKLVNAAWNCLITCLFFSYFPLTVFCLFIQIPSISVFPIIYLISIFYYRKNILSIYLQRNLTIQMKIEVIQFLKSAYLWMITGYKWKIVEPKVKSHTPKKKKLSHAPNIIETREYSGLESHDVCIGVSIVISGMPQSHSVAFPQSSHYSSACKFIPRCFLFFYIYCFFLLFLKQNKAQFS